MAIGNAVQNNPIALVSIAAKGVVAARGLQTATPPTCGHDGGAQVEEELFFALV